jgi:hypothetical protein
LNSKSSFQLLVDRRGESIASCWRLCHRLQRQRNNCKNRQQYKAGFLQQHARVVAQVLQECLHKIPLQILAIRRGGTSNEIAQNPVTERLHRNRFMSERRPQRSIKCVVILNRTILF